MKTSYTFCLTALLMVLVMAGCSSNLTYQGAMDKNRKSINEMAKLEDANFLVEAASFNLLEQELASVAASKGYSSALVELARKNEKDHENLQRELNKLARKKKIRIPGEMKTEHQRLRDELTSSGRSEFDGAFVSMMRRVNEENARLYESKSSGADDADIRAFAARHLGLLRNHADAISKVDEQLMHTHR